MRLFALFVIASLGFLANAVHAQQCHYVKNETDKFTRQKYILTEAVSIADKKVKVKRVYTVSRVDMQLRAEGEGRVMLLLCYFTQGASIVNTNNKIILLMSNGETLELPCTQNIPGVQKRGMNHGTTVMTFEFSLDEAAFKKLCYANITDMRITATINPVEFSVKESIDTYQLFRCLK